LKVFYSFLILFAMAILLMLPVSEAVYSFRTDTKTDTVHYQTAANVTTGNVTLQKAVYANDPSTIAITSDSFGDTPTLVAYNSTNRRVDMNGLVASSNRTLSVSYDYDALNPSGAISTFIDKIGFIWLIVIIGFAPAAIIAMWIRREE
jgi:hypothetical protein